MSELDDFPEDFFKYDPEDEMARKGWDLVWKYELSRKPWFSVIKYQFEAQSDYSRILSSTTAAEK